MTAEVAAAQPQQPPSLLATMAARFGVEPKKMLATLKATAFKGDVTDEQMMALLIVANQYGLNPWTKEIYAFPDKGGIVPVMGVDGWTRIMNSSPEFDGIEFTEGGEGGDAWVECVIYRKDRSRPTKVREYLKECKRNTGPWGSHPKRMLRHKAMIQCARVAFSFGGIYDEDEAAQIIERDVTPITGTVTTQGATARLREVATINQEGGNGNEGIHSGQDGGNPAAAAGVHQAGAGAQDGGGAPEVSEAGGKAGSPSQGDVVPAQAVIDKLRSLKTLDAIDEYISVFDGSLYSEADRQAIQQAYSGRRELLVDKPPVAGRKGVD